MGSFGDLVELTPLGKELAKKAEKEHAKTPPGIIKTKKRKHLSVENVDNATTAIMGKGFNQLFFKPKAPMGAKKG